MRPFPKSALRLISVLAVAAAVLTAAALLRNSRDTTVYASGFREEVFQQLKPGMEVEEVYSLLGQPLAVRKENSPERWCYGEAGVVRKGGAVVVENFLSPARCVLFNEAGEVLEVTGEGLAAIQQGMAHGEVLELLGEPHRRSPGAAMTLHYTTPGGEGLFRCRSVAVDSRSRVSDVISYQFYD